MANKAVFFDRDGTLNVDVHYLYRPEDFQWTLEAVEAGKVSMTDIVPISELNIT